MRHFSVGQLVPDQLDPGQLRPGRAQSLMPPRKANISPEQKHLDLVHCLLPQAPRSGEGLQRETVLEQSGDTVGMHKQGHQSHRDLNLSKLALQSRRIGATGRDFTLALTTPPRLCGDIGQGRF